MIHFNRCLYSLKLGVYKHLFRKIKEKYSAYALYTTVISNYAGEWIKLKISDIRKMKGFFRKNSKVFACSGRLLHIRNVKRSRLCEGIGFF